MDLMIEAKDKEQAVLHLYRIYRLYPVNHSSLRPPAENQTKETKGRKSSRKLRAVKAEKLKAERDTFDDELTDHQDSIYDKEMKRLDLRRSTRMIQVRSDKSDEEEILVDSDSKEIDASTKVVS
ncbi:hypothetical protein C0993_001675 [Termitomyces sp. T159_Od127]|nr:hypothetical protein C0993_001675 [Termitomyces sp. T159_Od127]